MTNIAELAEYYVDTVNPDLRFDKRKHRTAVEFMTVEVASLIQDAAHDEAILKRANEIMAEEHAKDN